MKLILNLNIRDLVKDFLFQTVRLVSFLSISFSVVAESSWRGELGYQSVDNVSNAQLNEDTFSDKHWSLIFGYSYFKDFDEGLSLTTSVDLENFDYQEWQGFSHRDLSLRLNLRKKLGLGPFVPSIGASLSVAHKDFDSDVRDQDQTQLSLYWSKRLSEAADLKIDLGYFKSSPENSIAAGPSGVDTGMGPPPMPGMSKPGDTFEQSRQSLGAEIGYAVSEDWFMVASIRYFNGDFDSTAQPNAEIIEASSAIVADPAIGDGFFSYRIDSRSWFFDLQWEYTLSDTWGLLFNYRYLNAEAKDWPVDYKVTRLGVSLIAAF